MARFVMSYRCYNWKTKNPVIDKMRTVLQDEGLFAKNKRKILHELSGVSLSTFDGWFEGETKDPKHATIMATMSALGYEEHFVKPKKPIDLDAELQAAAKWREQQQRAKERFDADAGPNGKARKRAKVKP